MASSRTADAITGSLPSVDDMKRHLERKKEMENGTIIPAGWSILWWSVSISSSPIRVSQSCTAYPEELSGKEAIQGVDACAAVVAAEPEITRMVTIAGSGDCRLILKAGVQGVEKRPILRALAHRTHRRVARAAASAPATTAVGVQHAVLPLPDPRTAAADTVQVQAHPVHLPIASPQQSSRLHRISAQFQEQPSPTTSS
ncbi:hypothetical protein B0H14DRAFT_3454970 [Mycena olivaceomarginata]|nr:hypothetical protein B0H14DRAFT_3454970 [Mycena olivaceomarginata]